MAACGFFSGRLRLITVFVIHLLLISESVVYSFLHRSTTSPSAASKTSATHSSKTDSTPSKQQTFFDENYEKLKDYKKKHGNCNVPKGYQSDTQLAGFVKRIRGRARDGTLAEGQRVKLNAIDFIYDPLADTWKERLEQLKAYQKENGHCGVTRSEDTGLGYWVEWIRKTPHSLSESQRRELDSLGFVWKDLLTARTNRLWTEKLERLKAYKAKHGHTRVPSRWHKDSELGNWVHSQRALYKKGILPEDRQVSLEALGFEWRLQNISSFDNTKNDKKWLIQYHKLEAFKAQHDHTNVSRYTDPKLGPWVSHQRQQYRRGALQKDRVQALEGLGFQWEIRQKNRDRQWMEKYKALLMFKDRHGHLQIPDKHELYDWSGDQRQRQYRGVLESDRKKLLDNIGFDWDSGPKT